MPAESIGGAAARVISFAKVARRKLRATKPAPPQYEHGQYFSRCPAVAAFMRYTGRTKKGQIPWVLSDGELRYLVAVGAYTNAEGFCKASQGRLAADLGVGRRLVGRWEAGLIEKGLAESIPISRQRGRWGFRILKLIYPPKPERPKDSQVKDAGYLPSLKRAEPTSDALNVNDTEEPLKGAR